MVFYAGKMWHWLPLMNYDAVFGQIDYFKLKYYMLNATIWLMMVTLIFEICFLLTY